MAIPGSELLEIPTIYKAYFLGLIFRIYPQKIWPNVWYVYVPPLIRILEFPLKISTSTVDHWTCTPGHSLLSRVARTGFQTGP